MASDAFFPFADTVEVAAKAGVTAIIQPGGSLRDKDSIQAATRTESPWSSQADGISDTEEAHMKTRNPSSRPTC